MQVKVKAFLNLKCYLQKKNTMVQVTLKLELSIIISRFFNQCTDHKSISLAIFDTSKVNLRKTKLNHHPEYMNFVVYWIMHG